MARLELLTYPDERLAAPAEDVTNFGPELRQLVDDLEETRLGGPSAVGIAAPQVGVLLRVAIVDVSSRRKAKGHGHLVLINPEILSWDGMAVGREGCLSVPDFTGNVIRPERVRLRSLDLDGEPWELDLDGFEARVAQHEMDHLDGVLFLDRLVSRRSDLFRRKERSWRSKGK